MVSEFKLYCNCKIPSASTHHENCINDGCHLKIKSIHQKYSELKEKLKAVEAERNALKTQLIFNTAENHHPLLVKKLHAVAKVAREAFNYMNGSSRHDEYLKKIDELMESK